MHSIGVKSPFRLWVVSFAILVGFSLASNSLISLNFSYLASLLLKYSFPLLLVSFLSLLCCMLPQKFSYLFFFLATIISAMGLMSVMTGNYKGNDHWWLFGVSFYSLSLSYLHSKGEVSLTNSPVIANPLLLLTGPVVIFAREHRRLRLRVRFEYYFSFLVLGIFLFFAISVPLSRVFLMLDRYDFLGVLESALLLEVFIYTNFCGLSLIVYALLGLLGIKIPLNFKQPFSATNLIDYWRGWHRSLSAVLKRLFFAPLKTKFGAVLVPILGTYLASGVWHGIGVNFIIWAAIHTVGFLITIHLLKAKSNVILISFVMISTVLLGRICSTDSDISRLLSRLSLAESDSPTYAHTILSNMSTGVQISAALGVSFILSEFLFQTLPGFREKRYRFYRHPIMQAVLCFLTVVLVSQNSTGFAAYGQR